MTYLNNEKMPMLIGMIVATIYGVRALLSPGDTAVYHYDDLQAAFIEGKWQSAHKVGTPIDNDSQPY